MVLGKAEHALGLDKFKCTDVCEDMLEASSGKIGDIRPRREGGTSGLVIHGQIPLSAVGHDIQCDQGLELVCFLRVRSFFEMGKSIEYLIVCIARLTNFDQGSWLAGRDGDIRLSSYTMYYVRYASPAQGPRRWCLSKTNKSCVRDDPSRLGFWGGGEGGKKHLANRQDWLPTGRCLATRGLCDIAMLQFRWNLESVGRFKRRTGGPFVRLRAGAAAVVDPQHAPKEREANRKPGPALVLPFLSFASRTVDRPAWCVRCVPESGNTQNDVRVWLFLNRCNVS